LRDVQALLWLLAGDTRVAGARAAIEDPRETVLLSAVCVWEAAIKSGLGKLRVPDDLPDQAICERATIVSSDAMFDRYGITRHW
jgi:PIN domain nuclease of toxin-antitoxin system